MCGFDEIDYPDFNRSELSDIQKNVISNFPEFGLYKIADDISDLKNTNKILIGNAIDDMCDIIIDLFEVKWRIENNSFNDGIWHFKLMFQTHTKQHVLDLLNYISLIYK